jgi:hypothetical protein
MQSREMLTSIRIRHSNMVTMLLQIVSPPTNIVLCREPYGVSAAASDVDRSQPPLDKTPRDDKSQGKPDTDLGPKDMPDVQVRPVEVAFGTQLYHMEQNGLLKRDSLVSTGFLRDLQHTQLSHHVLRVRVMTRNSLVPDRHNHVVPEKGFGVRCWV